MENVIVSIIENKEITFGILFFFMLFYVFWRNQNLSERAEIREDKLLEHNQNLLKYNEEFIEQLKELNITIEKTTITLQLIQKEIELLMKLNKSEKKKEYLTISSTTNDLTISDNFKLREFESLDTQEVKLKPELIDKLEKLRKTLHKPIIINSGYRTPEHNCRVNGSPNSKHLEGMAADIRNIEGLSNEELAATASDLGFGGIGIYDWGVHVDVRKTPKRWDSRRKE